MGQVRLIEIKEEILFANRHCADEIRDKLRKDRVFMLNLMAFPGAGSSLKMKWGTILQRFDISS